MARNDETVLDVILDQFSVLAITIEHLNSKERMTIRGLLLSQAVTSRDGNPVISGLQELGLSTLA